MAATKKGKKSGKKGSKKGKKASPTAPLEIATSGFSTMDFVPVKATQAFPFKKLIATFVIKYAHPKMPYFLPKQLEASPIEQTTSLKRSNVVVEFLVCEQVVPFWLTSGPNPEAPSLPIIDDPPNKEEMQNDIDIEDYTEEKMDRDDEDSPEDEPLQYHQATIKADIDSTFSIRISNEYVFTRIAAEIIVDGRPVSDGKYICEPAPVPPLTISGFEVSEDAEQTNGSKVLSVEKFMFQKRLAISETLTREILNAGFDGEIVINIYR